MKAYWIATYKIISDINKLKKYMDKVIPIFKSFGAKPLVRAGKFKTF